jgi:predicted transcriptional regulator
MTRSKLELRLEILKVLEHEEWMSPTQIMYRVNTCHEFLRQHLAALIEENLVEQKTGSGNRIKYAIAQRGLETLRNYGKVRKLFQINMEQPF